jgi:hypothetical protein
MKLPLPEADSRRTALVEACADLRLPAVPRVERAAAVLHHIRNTGVRDTIPGMFSVPLVSNRCLPPRAASQKTIQSP